MGCVQSSGSSGEAEEFQLVEKQTSCRWFADDAPTTAFVTIEDLCFTAAESAADGLMVQHKDHISHSHGSSCRGAVLLLCRSHPDFCRLLV